MEIHPRIRKVDKALTEKKIILGSFPTWTLTAPDEEKGETLEEKEFQRNKNNDLPFFYGSSINKFWIWYENFIDSTITKENIKGIKKSLRRNGMGITDVIFECSRKNRSSLDSALSNRIYNHNFFKYPKFDENLKILCTSKGVMNDMLLNKAFFSQHIDWKINFIKSDHYQSEIVSKIKGDVKRVKKPCYRLLENENGGTIECFSIPSPGSPYRRLNDFGRIRQHPDEYLNRYLEEVFLWFKS
jgi:hypothetical protein